MPIILEACRLDLSAVTIPFYNIIAPFFVFCFQPCNVRNRTGALNWPPPNQMHKLPNLINFVKALQIQIPIFTYSMPKKELLSEWPPLQAEAQLRVLHAPLCLLFRSLRLSSAFQEPNNAPLLSPRYAEPQAARLLSQEFLPHHQENGYVTPHNCYSTTYSSNSQKCHWVASFTPSYSGNLPRAELLEVTISISAYC